MEAHDWIELGIFVLGIMGAIVGIVRYIDAQISNLNIQIVTRTGEVDRELSDKISIGEYNRRHEDLERRTRALERWQDHANGRVRSYYSKEDEEK